MLTEIFTLEYHWPIRFDECYVWRNAVRFLPGLGGERGWVRTRCPQDKDPVIRRDFQKNGGGRGSSPLSKLKGDRERHNYDDSSGSTPDAKKSSYEKIFRSAKNKQKGGRLLILQRGRVKNHPLFRSNHPATRNDHATRYSGSSFPFCFFLLFSSRYIIFLQA